MGYDNKAGLISEEIKNSKNAYIKESIEAFDLSKIENDEAFYNLMLEVYKLLNDIITLIAENSPEMALKLYLLSAKQRTIYGSTSGTIESRFIKEIEWNE